MRALNEILLSLALVLTTNFLWSSTSSLWQSMEPLRQEHAIKAECQRYYAARKQVDAFWLNRQEAETVATLDASMVALCPRWQP